MFLWQIVSDPKTGLGWLNNWLARLQTQSWMNLEKYKHMYTIYEKNYKISFSADSYPLTLFLKFLHMPPLLYHGFVHTTCRFHV